LGSDDDKRNREDIENR